MPIKLKILKRDQKVITQMGGRLLSDAKTWIIPDEIQNINPFMKWLPTREGHIVQKPYFSLRAKYLCWKCKRDTPCVRHRIWGNCCIHCQALQEEDDEYTPGFDSPFTPHTFEAARQVRVIYFKLEFDYYIRSVYVSSTLSPVIIP